MGVPEELLARLYLQEGAHSREHALETRELSIQISHEPEYEEIIDDRDRLLISIAALIHDVGYQLRRPYWSGTQWEHPYESAAMLERIENIENLGPTELALVKFLILNHDNTNYRFPAYRFFETTRDGVIEFFGVPPGPHPGIAFATPDVEEYLEETPPKFEKFEDMLHILQEADSRLGSAERTIDFSISRGIPVVANDGGLPGIGMPMWQYSGVANVLLAGCRALLDAYTKNGQEEAWQSFLKTRAFIKEIIESQPEHIPGYDNVGELLRRQDVEEFIWSSPSNDRARTYVRISQAFPLEGVSLLMKGDRKIGQLASRLVNIEDIILPPDFEEGAKAEFLRYLRESIIKNYALDILTMLSGALRVFASIDYQPSREHTLTPPILQGRGLYTIQSGGEWVLLAQELGLSQIRALFID